MGVSGGWGGGGGGGGSFFDVKYWPGITFQRQYSKVVTLNFDPRWILTIGDVDINQVLFKFLLFFEQSAPLSDIVLPLVSYS